MALTVEDGTGLAAADSYQSLADADNYVAAHGADATWTAAADADKEEGLRLATQYLDTTYGGRWRGLRANDTQALAWPRDNAVDDDGYAIDDESVPARLEDACSELAVKAVGGDTLVADITNPGSIKRELRIVGPITKEDEYVGGKSQIKNYRLVELLLRPLIHPGMQVARA